MSANIGRLSATQLAARTIACADVAVALDLLGDQREEPLGVRLAVHRAVRSPESRSSRSRSPITPLWANSRPRCSNGCVFSGSTAPVDAYRTCATNVPSCTSRASWANAGPRRRRAAAWRRRGSPSARTSRGRCRRARGGSAAPASRAPRAARTWREPVRAHRSFRTGGTRPRRYRGPPLTPASPLDGEPDRPAHTVNANFKIRVPIVRSS